MALPPAETFEDLLVWRKSHQLTLKVYKLPLEELRYYFILARDLEYFSRIESREDIDEIRRMLAAYTRTLLGPAS